MSGRKPGPARKASGENIEEWQRNGLKIQFRLSKEETDALVDQARAEELSPNAYAARLVRIALRVV